MYVRNLVPIGLTILALLCVGQESAQAGPFTDWLFGGFRRQPPAYPVGPAYAAGAPALGAYYGASMPVTGAGCYGYLPQNPGAAAAAALPQPTVAYLPDYRTSYYRAPVTYYRPILSTDPNTGAQIIAMAPCTSYEYQTQRVPTWGRQSWYGPYASAPQAPIAPRGIPTYTLPSGGIPVAGTAPMGYAMGYPNYSTPIPFGSAPYASGYGSYSALQPGAMAVPNAAVPPGPALTVPPAGQYPTSPYGGVGGYYGTTSGGSSGNFLPQTIPGLTAPVPSATPMPPAGGFQPGAVLPPNIPSPTLDPSYNPGLPVGPMPSNTSPGQPFSNPASPDVPPTLPNTSSFNRDNRNRFQSVVRQPGNNGTNNETEPATGENTRQPVQSLLPIPVPDQFKHEPRWNPGLLKEDDQTAQTVPQQAAPPASETPAATVWGSKTIQWASFTQPANSKLELQAPQSTPSSSTSSGPTSRLRPVTKDPAVAMVPLPSSETSTSSIRVSEPNANSTTNSAATGRHYPTGGWKPSR